MVTLGERIKEKRKALGMTQGELSGPDLSIGMVSLIERNQTTPSIKSINLIATKLGIPVSELLGEKAAPIEDSFVQTDIYQVKRIINMSTTLLKAGRYDDVEKTLENISLSEDLRFYYGPIKKIIGIVKLEQHNYIDAIKLFNEALLYLSPIEGNDLISVYYYLSECYLKVENYHLSIENALYGVILLKSKYYAEDVLLKLKFYYNLSYCYCRINEYIKGLDIISESIALMEEEELYYSQGLFYMLKGVAELYLSNYSEGLLSTKKALNLLDKKKDQTKVIGCLTNIGIMYREVGKYDESLMSLKKSLNISEKLNEKWLQLNNIYEIMLTYYNLKDFVQLEKYSEHAMLLSEVSVELKIKVLLVMAPVKIQQGLSTEAGICVSKAEKLSKEINDIYLISKSYSVKAEILSNEGDFIKANKFLQMSNDILLSIPRTNRIKIMQ